ncbi:hypothetical protein [Paractinoplanes lichenicola]|uniref:Uncharacterized protein n=1 Tax=Paractinoplanes lichenicola TaxID=2802976 RepID=A0ABS1VF85_9ACTN|nr:hypothetical protein [Actinoplanes lichenicola]MBL7252975.1 hypothetical protein [Actinoplanes lichenicola]
MAIQCRARIPCSPFDDLEEAHCNGPHDNAHHDPHLTATQPLAALPFRPPMTARHGWRLPVPDAANTLDCATGNGGRATIVRLSRFFAGKVARAYLVSR